MPQDTRRTRRRWLVVGLALAVVLVIAGTIRALAGQVIGTRLYLLPTTSMAPTLLPGDRVQADEGAATKEPRRGEIWVFVMPAAAQPGGTPAIKRIIGLPGETVAVRAGQVFINGRPLAEPYLVVRPNYTMPPRTLGPDEFFVLGDNRNNSHDGHVWGPLPRSLLLGRARTRVWPLGRAGAL